MNGELRAAKRRLDSGKPKSTADGWVMAFNAKGTRPRKALCHDTVFDWGVVGGGSDTSDHMREQAGTFSPSRNIPFGRLNARGSSELAINNNENALNRIANALDIQTLLWPTHQARIKM